MSLRDELGLAPDPVFEIELPRGWVRRAPDDENLRAMLDGLRRKLMTVHQPQLYAQLRAQVKASFAEMRAQGVSDYFAPDDADPTALYVAGSMTARIRHAEPGEDLTALIALLIRDHGATPLFGDKRTVRVEREQTQQIEDQTLSLTTITYLTPVPGTRLKRALELVASFGRTPDMSPDEPRLQAMRTLFDACASTVRWRAPDAR